MSYVFDRHNTFLFRAPFCVFVTGVSEERKQAFLMQFLNEYDVHIHPKPSEIHYCYLDSHYKIPVLKEAGVKMHMGMDPDIHKKTDDLHVLYILDHVTQNLSNEALRQFIDECFAKNISILYFTDQRMLIQNTDVVVSKATSIILLRCHGDLIRHLANRFYPDNYPAFIYPYLKALAHSSGYLVIDLDKLTGSVSRFRTNFIREPFTDIRKLYSTNLTVPF